MFIRSRRTLLTMGLIGLMALASTGAYAAQRFERQFLGIRLMSRGINVLRKFGSPNKVVVADTPILQYFVNRLPDRDFLTVGVGNLDTMNGGAASSTPNTGPYGATGGGPYGPPGAMPGAPAATDNTDANGMKKGRFVVWVYEFPKKGVTNAFLLDEEGRIVSIVQLGGIASAKTSRGIGIGSTYASTVRLYGFPEEHSKKSVPIGANANNTQTTNPLDMLSVSYDESHGVGFIFMSTKLRGYPLYTGQGPWCVGVIVSATG